MCVSVPNINFIPPPTFSQNDDGSEAVLTYTTSPEKMLSGTIKFAPDDDLFRIESCGKDCHVLIHEGDDKANAGIDTQDRSKQPPGL